MSGQEDSRCKKLQRINCREESTVLQTERTTTALLFKERESERKEKPQKIRTHVNKEGNAKTSRQMDTLDTVKSNRRRQTVGGGVRV